MDPNYKKMIESVPLQALYEFHHKHNGVYPTGFVVVTKEKIDSFPFTICPLYIVESEEELKTEKGGKNCMDVIVFYDASMGSLESVLYSLWEEYKETKCTRTKNSMKRYIYENHTIPRKIVIPTLGRGYNLECVIRRFKMIEKPIEGYYPPIMIVEHSPNAEFEDYCKAENIEYLWFFLDPRDPTTPIGQFNKALCYDKAFLFGEQADWYLFHDNDVLVPHRFWYLLDENCRRVNAKFIQPYTHRCLLGLKEWVAPKFREDLTLVDKPIDPKDYNEIMEGAPGGSLYIHRDRYIEAGGHDPNYCWGWGPEDALFFFKVKLFEPIAYADEPPIEMVHLYHPSASPNSIFHSSMEMLVRGYFMRQTREDLEGYFHSKRELFKQYLSRV